MSESAGAWLPLWIGDLQTSTSRLSPEQFGAYVRLLMDYWANGPLPADDRQLAQITGLTKQRWRRHRVILCSYFQERDGKWFQARSDLEREKAQVFAARRTEKARKAAESRWSNDTESRPPSNARGMRDACSPQPQPYLRIKSEADYKPGSPRQQAYADGVDLLTGHGRPPSQARAIISKWLNRYKESDVLAAIWQATLLEVAEPIGWIELQLRQKLAEQERESPNRFRLERTA